MKKLWLWITIAAVAIGGIAMIIISGDKKKTIEALADNINQRIDREKKRKQADAKKAHNDAVNQPLDDWISQRTGANGGSVEEADQ